MIILTNDGDLINELTHPSAKVPKLYRVVVNSAITQNDIDKMYKGIEIEPGKTAYAQVDVLEIDKTSTVMEILLYQGLNRQIRKMFEYLGYEVVSLKRVQHAILNLDGLKRGEFKPIKPRQIKDLRNFLNRIAQKMIKAALVGNIASGKSAAENILLKLGYKVLDTDKSLSQASI